MTQQQKKAIDEIYKGYLENKSKYVTYVPDDYCSFVTYKNELSETDSNIVVEWVRISQLNDSLLPETEVINFLVEPTGFYYDMNGLKDIFRSNKEINNYISKLKKFDWNGE